MNNLRRIVATATTALMIGAAGIGWAGCDSDDVNNAVTDAQNKADQVVTDAKDKANEVKKDAQDKANEVKKDAQDKYDDLTNDKGDGKKNDSGK